MTQGEGRAPALLTIAVNSLRWVTAKLGLFLAISTVATTLIFLRAGARPVKGQYPDFAWARYWPALKQYAGHLLSGRFGPVYQPPPEAGGYPEQIPTGALVDGLVWQPLSTSLVVFGVALVLGVVTGILVGMAASRFGGRFGRRLATGTALTLLSFPDILFIVLVQFGLIKLGNAVGYHLIPAYGTWNGILTVRHAILPIFLLALFPAAYSARLATAAFDEVFGAEYIRTARAKGVAERRIKWRHAFRNAFLPILSGLSTVTGLMVSNLIVLEFVLNVAGIGRLIAWEVLPPTRVQLGMYYPSPNIISSAVICLAAVFVVIDGLADLALIALDPRVRDARREQMETPHENAGSVPWRERLADLGRGLLTLPSALTGLFDPRRLPGRLRACARYYRGNLPLLTGTGIVFTLVFVALFAPVLAPYHPGQTHMGLYVGDQILMPPFKPGTPGFLFGSDAIGRDLLSRVIYGARFTLLIIGVIVPLRFLLAFPLGLAAGWLRGRWERFVQAASIILGAIPALVIPMILIPMIYVPPDAKTLGNPNALPPPNPYEVLLFQALILVLIGWPRLAESVRLATRELATRPFVEGARAVGATPWRIMWRHILPQMYPTLAVAIAAEAAWLMMFMSQLGAFDVWLGGSQNLEAVGHVPQFPDWSHMLARPVRYMWSNQWNLIVPGLAFFVAILGFNLLAEGMRRASQRVEAPIAESAAAPASLAKADRLSA